MTMPGHIRPIELKISSHHLDWEQFDHSTYSSDLALSDNHLFLKLNQYLVGQRHNDDNSVQMTMLQWLLSEVANFYRPLHTIREQPQKLDELIKLL